MALNLSSNLDTIPMTSAQLTNADGTKTATAGIASASYEHINGTWTLVDKDGIEDVTKGIEGTSNITFNIAEQRVLTPTNGIFIRNERKILLQKRKWQG